MQTLTITINIVHAIEELASKVNKQPVKYLHDLIQVGILAAKPLSEILGPFHDSFRQSGLTEEEFDQLIEEELQAMREEKRERTIEAR